MPDETPSADGHELWRTSNEAALALVDTHLGLPAAWSASAMLEYRLDADFQADWKAEVGHWIFAAESNGFLENMLKPLLGERDKTSRNAERSVNDPRHLKLHQQLAAAMMCHYLTGTGWAFDGWETETGGAIDIDLAMKASGALVELQAKASGTATGDDQYLIGLEKGVQQLPAPSRSVAMVGLFAQREPHRSLPGDPSSLIRRLYGSSCQYPGEVLMPRTGPFLVGGWDHLAGVFAIDLLRGIDTVRYSVTVFLNPRAHHPANPDWFPKARVLVVEGDRLRWIRGAPWGRCTVPDGTRLVDQLP
jgi:hypothetical protein